MKSFKKQPFWFQRGLCTPLDALTYSNDVLLVMGALTILGGIFVVGFGGDIASMSQEISSINEFERKYLNEKIEVVTVDLTDTHTIITLTNYGKYPVEIRGVVDMASNELVCNSNNSDSADFIIQSDDLLEITCAIVIPFNSTAIHYVITDTIQIITVEP